MRARSLLPVLAMCLFGAACAETDQTGTPSSSAGTEQPRSPGKSMPPDTGPADDPEPAPATCTGAPGSFYELSVRKLAVTEELKLCTLKGSVVLIVNGASACGYTPQYEPLQKLYAKYRETQNRPFEILGFPSRSFNQEKSTDAEVSSFCTEEYHITFPLLTIGPVVDNESKGESAQPVYQWLHAQPNMGEPVAWNFEKFLISKDGKAVKRWLTAVSPDEGGEIDQAIAAELAK